MRKKTFAYNCNVCIEAAVQEVDFSSSQSLSLTHSLTHFKSYDQVYVRKSAISWK